LVTAAKTVSIGNVTFGNTLPLAVIAGPCQLESRAHALEVASALKEIAQRLNIGLVYKTSFDKANRTSAGARRGIGLEAALPIFAEIRDTLKLPVLARAAVAVGVAGVFIETHPDPDHAPSDGPNMVPLKDFEALVKNLMAFDAVAKEGAR
jgi:2-dehydro-3-deoxyphosphooctonate aldolase (KDO 8-P synthase)